MPEHAFYSAGSHAKKSKLHRGHVIREFKRPVAPLLQRLLDKDPGKAYDASDHPISLETYYEMIRQNLEWLLNTRVKYLNWLEAYHELKRSLANYGISDFMHSYYGSGAAQNQLADEIKQAIAHFEPRLSQIEVYIQSEQWEQDRILRMRIEAVIDAPQGSTTAVFESALDITNHHFIFER